MSIHFMLLIAGLYLAASVSFAFEGKIEWCLVALCWGVGNAILGIVSQ